MANDRASAAVVVGSGVLGAGALIYYLFFAKTRIAVGWLMGKPMVMTLRRLSVKLENGGAAWLRDDVADAFEAMRSAAEGDGVQLRVASAFRTMDEQILLAVRNRITGIQTAPPGWSNHQQGTTLDLDVGVSSSHVPGTNAAWSWLQNNAQSYGFCRSVQSEAWHYTYIGSSTNEPCLSCQSCVS